MWKKGSIKINTKWYRYWIKVYDERSKFGIDGGRISKLMLKRNEKVVCNYDRGWDVDPVDEDTNAALQILLLTENH